MKPQQSPTISKSRIKDILRLALPIIAGMSSQNLLNLVDVAMVGRLGTAPLAAVGLGSMVIWVVTSPLQGLGPAVQAITARRMGQKQIEDLHRAIVNAIYTVLLLGFPYVWFLLESSDWIFAQLTSDPEIYQIGLSYANIRLYTVAIIGLNFCFRGYFNGRKLAVLYMQTLLMMHPINIVLNFLLIYGHMGFPALGADGAALGTAIATTLGCLNFIRLMIKHHNPGFSISPKVVSRRTQANLFRLGMPGCLQTFSLALGFLLFFHIAGLVGREALAATNILINLSLVCTLVSIGLGLAVITLVGNSLGENDPREAKNWVKTTAFLASAAIGSVGILFALFPEFWLFFFTNEPQVVQIAALPLVILGLSQIFDAAGLVFSYAHLGGGANKTVMVVSFVNQWVIFLPACYIWITYFDGRLLHLWVCMFCYRFLLFLSFWVSIRRGRWLTVVV